LHWFGFDADLRPGGGYVDAAELLEPHRADPLVQRILQRLARVDDESRAEEIRRLRDLLDFLESNDADIRACLGDADAVELARTLRALTAGFQFIEAGKEGPMSPNWDAALREREKTMFRQMDQVLADLPPGEKVILLGHMMHLSKDSDTLYFGFTDDPNRDPAWPTIGNYLAKKHPDQVYSIWMLYDHGRHGVPMLEEPIVEIESDPHRIEYLLAKAGSLFFLPLHTNDPREAYLHRERNFINNGQPGSGILANQADAFFFIAEINPPGGREEADT
jgi:erythromycin esterase-like protein